MKMSNKAFILLAALLLLVSSSAFSEEKTQQHNEKVAQDEVKANEIRPANQVHNTWHGGSGGGAGGGVGAAGFSGGYSHGGVYGGGQRCHFGCCSKSSGWSLGQGGYYGCTCCHSAEEAEAFKEIQGNEQIKN